MSGINEDTWKWLKTAPLPVVLAITLSMFSLLAAWSYAIEHKQAEDSTKVAVAVEKATQAAAIALRIEQKQDKTNDKLDDLMEVILTIRAQDMAEKAVIARNLAKKEKK